MRPGAGSKTSGRCHRTGLPLALLADGRLHTLGVYRLYLGSPDERALIPQPSWFLDPGFVEETRLKAYRGASLFEMTPSMVISHLGEVVGERSKSTPAP